MTSYRQWLEEEADFTNEQQEAFEAFVENRHQTLDDTFDGVMVAHFEQSYQGHWDKFVDFVQERFDENTEIPDHLIGYIDYEAVARDWRHDFWESDGHVFADL